MNDFINDPLADHDPLNELIAEVRASADHKEEKKEARAQERERKLKAIYDWTR